MFNLTVLNPLGKFGKINSSLTLHDLQYLIREKPHAELARHALNLPCLTNIWGTQNIQDRLPQVTSINQEVVQQVWRNNLRKCEKNISLIFTSEV